MEGFEGKHAELDLPDSVSKSWAEVAAEDSAMLMELLHDRSPRKSVSSSSSSGYVSSSENEVKVAEELSEAMEEDELGQQEAKETLPELVLPDFGNRSWVDVVAEDEQLFNEVFEDRSPREYNSSTSDSKLGDPVPRDHPEDVTYPANVSSSSTRTRLGRGMPKLGWCTSPEILQRRDREIKRAKELPSYVAYSKEVDRLHRVKGVHPRTPNKLINSSRRNWDAQMKIWKRSLYNWRDVQGEATC
ncbi:hypothetical protein L596_013757 [Steinernema carpocapsae]|uniref:Histone RNA hairpin-binding protein RNA-binding domain-containing protein n=1 Tax=Steinernema carpocapsae TaxID=34508 RepID=A0A4U5P279_STECR|nr:hypothetical protein L596_013757 [Steinernema carpocapsae]